MNITKKMFLAGLVCAAAFGATALHAAVGEVAPLSRPDLGKVEAMLAKLLKGKPAVQSGTKEELEAGWRIECLASVGSGGNYTFVVKAEKTMTLGYIESQKPAPDAPADAAKSAAPKAGTKKS